MVLKIFMCIGFILISINFYVCWLNFNRNKKLFACVKEIFQFVSKLGMDADEEKDHTPSNMRSETPNIIKINIPIPFNNN